MSSKKSQPPKPFEQGNWPCPQCQNVNYAHRDTCNRCKGPRPHGGGMGPVMGIPVTFAGQQLAEQIVSAFTQNAVPPGPMDMFTDPLDAAIAYLESIRAARQQMLGHHGFDDRGFGFPGAKRQLPWGTQDLSGKRMRFDDSHTPAGAPRAGVDGNWMCPNASCGNVNYPRRTACNRCGKDRTPEQDQEAKAFLAASEAQYQGGGGGGGMMMGGGGGGGGPGFGRFQPTTLPGGAPISGAGGNWSCSSCSNVNFARRTTCNRCGLAKADHQ